MAKKFRRFEPEPPPWLYAWMAQGSRFRRVYRRLAGDLAAGVPKGARLLDVGTGPGYLLAQLARERPDLRLFGLDLSPAMIRRARTGQGAVFPAPPPNWLVAGATVLPFQPGTFHQVTASFSFHIWPDPALGVKEIMRVLVPGGRGWIYELNREAAVQDLRAFAREEGLPLPLVYLGFKTVSWHHALRREEFARVFQEAGACRWQLSPAHHLFWRAEIEV
jgi:ubiquinone/menaquinone biosynthesis C-methylase UbiE